MSKKNMQTREQELEALLVKIHVWTERELTQGECDQMSSYTHADCGYEQAQSDLQTLVEEHLTEPPKPVWDCLRRPK